MMIACGKSPKFLPKRLSPPRCTASSFTPISKLTALLLCSFKSFSLILSVNKWWSKKTPSSVTETLCKSPNCVLVTGQ